MTNGEKFCIDFPNIRIEVFVSYVQVVGENYEFNNLYPLKWWNAEYKEPTTKENLAVDCIDRKKLIDWINIWDITPIIKNPLIRHIQGMSSVTPQEPKPMVEIDLYSVIKQKYIEREVLDKLRAEIDKARFVDKDTRICKNALASGLEVALQIIDKYKGENEG